MTTKLLRTLMGMVALVAMLTACSSEDVILDEPNAKAEITFNVTNNRASRAATNISSSEGIKKFNLAAWVHEPDFLDFESYQEGSKPYITNDVYTLEGASWKNANGCRYWPNDPENEVLDFFAWVYDNNTTNIVPNAYESGCKFDWHLTPYVNAGGESLYRPMLTVKQANEAKDQYDLLYAAIANNKAFYKTENKEEDPKTPNLTTHSVDLDFNHAMSMIQVAARSINKNIHIEIMEVGLENIVQEAEFYFPAGNDNLAHWQYQDLTNGQYNRNRCVSSKVDSETQENANPLIKLDGTPSTTTYTSIVSGDNSFMVIPIDYTNAYGVGITDGFKVNSSQCIRLKCKIWNVANGDSYMQDDDPDGTFASDLVIYGDKQDGSYTYKNLYIPIVFNWEMGKKYTYCLTFGGGNAGCDADGNPSLIKVEYDVELENNWDTSSPDIIVNEPNK